MTMRFNPRTVTVASDGCLRLIFAWLDWMRTASPTGPGWTVVQSSNGTDGGAGDNIAAFGDLTHYTAGVSQSWFVLEAPTGGAQFLWARYDTTDTNWRVYYSPEGSYSGGTVGAPPTTPGDSANYGWVRINSNVITVSHMGADDEPPYGFYLYGHASGNFASCYSMWAWVPVIATQAGDTDLYVHIIGNPNTGCAFTEGYLAAENTNYTFTHCASILAGETTSQVTPALAYSNNQGTFAPNACFVDTSGADLSFPVPFGRRNAASTPTGFKGISTFMQWNGAPRAAGETFATKTRVSWGDVNFPWDGSTPEVS